MNQYFEDYENDISSQFLNKGYVIQKVADNLKFLKMQEYIANRLKKYTGKSRMSSSETLNSAHKFINPLEVNKIRLAIINDINSESWFRPYYYSLVKNIVNIVVGNELSMQLKINLSIQLPQDKGSLLPVHADVWSGNSPYEVVAWIPLVDCYLSKSMFILSPNEDHELRKSFKNFSSMGSEDLFNIIKERVDWITINAGQVLVFNQNLPHGNRVNSENETRWSMNCRFKSIFAPYSDKKNGEYYEPITLRAASRVGASYKFPELE